MDESIIKIDYDNIDVKEIMNSVYESIKSRGISNDELNMLNEELEFDSSNDEADINDLRHKVMLLNSCYNIAKTAQIRSGKKLIGPVIIVFKRMIRKLTFWYFEFLFDQQNTVNRHATESINSLKNIQINYVQRIEVLENEVKSLNKKLIELENIKSDGNGGK